MILRMNALNKPVLKIVLIFMMVASDSRESGSFIQNAVGLKDYLSYFKILFDFVFLYIRHAKEGASVNADKFMLVEWSGAKPYATDEEGISCCWGVSESLLKDLV